MRPPPDSPRAAFVTYRRLAAVAIAVSLIVTSGVVVRASAGGKFSITLKPGVNGLLITTKGATCTALPTPTPLPTPASNAPPVTCSGHSYQGVALSLPNNSQQKIYFLPLANYTGQDTTGSGNGWNITFQASRLTCTGPIPGGCARNAMLSSGSIYMAPPTVACPAGVTCSGTAAKPSIVLKAIVPIDTTGGVKVASAAKNTAMGFPYTFTPGTVTCANIPTQQHVPGNQCATTGLLQGPLGVYVPPGTGGGTYSSTLTESIISGP